MSEPDLQDGFLVKSGVQFPPDGKWAAAGRRNGVWGIHMGLDNELCGFIFKRDIARTVKKLRRAGEPELADQVAGVRDDVIALWRGKLQLTHDLEGQRLDK